jgi:coenzyme F420 hydrogenase subunit beta
MKNIDPKVLSIAFTHKSLCTRCGTCVGACPTQALSLDEQFYPRLDPDRCIECGLCARTCPGGQVQYKQLTRLTFGHDQDTSTFDGHVQRTYVGYATDPRIRAGGAGGGVITALLWDLLKSGTVDGCIVTRMNPEKPWHGQVFIARTYKELLESQQSKYIIIPVNAIFQTLYKEKGRFALAALPCHLHGFRLLAHERKELGKKIHIAIGLFCASALEPYVAEEMMEMKGLDKKQAKNVNFRGGKWPGRIRAILKNGQIKSLHYSNFKDGAINYLTYLYSPFRCQTCIDGSAEFSDISVSDAWTRDSKGNYLFESQSRLLARTEKGVRTMEAAIDHGTLTASDVTTHPSYKTHRLHTRKKGLNAPLRVQRLAKDGKLAPRYDRTVEEVSPAERRAEKIESFIMSLGRRRATRYPLFKFLTSRYGIPFVKLRQKIKSKKYR